MLLELAQTLCGQGDTQPCPLVCVTSLLLACGNVVDLSQRGLTRGDVRVAAPAVIASCSRKREN